MATKETQEFQVTGRGCSALALQLGLGLSMVASVGYCVLLFILQFVSTAWYDKLNAFRSPLAPLLGLMRQTLDPRSLKLDVAPLVAALVCVVVWFTVASLLDGVLHGVKGKGGSGAAAPMPEYDSRRAARMAPAPAPTGGASRLAAAQGKKKSHLDLLKIIAAKKKEIEGATGEVRDALNAEIKEAQDELEAMKRHLAFMACDVVGSTKMKASQNPMIIEHAFLAFREWADFIMKRNGVWKASWTPDGCMAAFPSLDQAVLSAQEMLQDIPRFNSDGHEMDVPFQVRLGINDGSVLFPEKSTVDEITDQVIDLAGHLQKYADPDSLLVAKQALDKLKDSKSFRGHSVRVDGFDTFIWKA